MSNDELRQALECAMQTGRELDARFQEAKRLLRETQPRPGSYGFVSVSSDWCDRRDALLRTTDEASVTHRSSNE